jgi:2'-5' RNA ligase
MATEHSRRLFFALWPEESIAERIAAATALHERAAGGRAIPPRKLHLTLAFLGSVAASRLPCVRAAAGALRGAPFELLLCRVEHWARPRILALAPAESPPALAALVADLWRALAACAYEPETRPFRAHLTLAREARPPRGVRLEIDPIAWQVRELCLTESITDPRGARYERLQSWPLAHDNLGAPASPNAL